jgi:hypothetical protein
MCDYCIKRDYIRGILLKFADRFNFQFEDPENADLMYKQINQAIFNMVQLQNSTPDLLLKGIIRYNLPKYDIILESLKDYKAILFHRNIAKCQKSAYLNDLEKLAEFDNTILIELDFKQKITIGLSPRQPSREYYNQKTRTCLGLFLQYLPTNIL